MLDDQTPRWIDRLDRLLPGFGIPNLALYLIGAQVCGFLLTLANPNAMLLLVLDPYMVMRGEVWRLVTFLAVPLSFNTLWMVFALYFLYFIINALEEEWGEFRTTLYVLVAMLFTIAFSFAFSVPIYNIVEFQSTLFLAVATIAPEYQILLFFVLPVKTEMAGVVDGRVYHLFADCQFVAESVVPVDHVRQLPAFFRAVFRGTDQGILPSQEIPA